MIKPGDIWRDTDGNPIQAHGGGILHHGGAFYWYGEHKGIDNETDSDGKLLGRTPVIGVACYRSTNLVDWQYLGLALPAVQDNQYHDLHPRRVVERPKVIYNAKTKKFVMWVHIDARNYATAGVGVAIADQPEGPFQYLYGLRPQGCDSRDQTVFIDDDGTGYHVCSSDMNATTLISKMTDDYTSLTGEHSRHFVQRSMEAQSVCKQDGRYWMVASGCTGWDPNPARSAVADVFTGPWTELDNPCVGPDAEITFHAQSTFLLTLPGGTMAMFDRWNKNNLQDSRYVWLPIEFRDNQMRITWQDQWDPASLLG